MRRLDVLAVEPLFGGFRRESLRGFMRHTSHRVHLLKLPPRRPQRRLIASGVWFHESICLHPPRHEVDGKVRRIRFDAVLAGDHLHLSDLQRLHRPLQDKPAVVLHHGDGPTDLRSQTIRLNSLKSATEIWTPTAGSRDALLEEVRQAGVQFPALGDQTDQVAAKVRLMAMPVEVGPPLRSIERTRRRIAVDATSPPADGVVKALHRLHERGEKFELFVIGKHGNALPADAVAQTVKSTDDLAVCQALRRCRSFLGTPTDRPFDPLAVRALRCECWVLLHDTGPNRAILPPFHHSASLHTADVRQIYGWLLTVLHQGLADGSTREMTALLSRFDPTRATEAIDEALLDVAGARDYIDFDFTEPKVDAGAKTKLINPTKRSSTR
ncbi:MAG: DUF3524 domain-containing protein [Planctomycetota bacterium]